ncbi:2-amino-4-hydroxy-6-hydroxymethyldihydropteridine diphosphokinase [Pseudolysinimonas sp.]|uniref:2-amino-4-hydroxy-6- hydroxymethyldihydropteridine diphosphokinase n=1 Tax=Pseudolysinimonas sp. TaxID=2680009 RepID=UPI003F7FF600
MIVGDVAAGRPAVVAFGANLGDRRATVLAAVRELAGEDGVEVTAVSDVVESVAVKPAGEDPAAPAYLNGVVLLRTTLAPVELLVVLNRIEDAHGRVRIERWGDRTLDLDLIDYDGEVSDDPRLTLPHPHAVERDFVLRPWLQVDGEATLTGRGRVADLLAALEAGR